MSSSTAAPALERPMFIVGPGRSGTTLLRSLLSAHSRIAVTPETHFMAHAEGRGLERGAPADFETFWSGYTSWVRFADLGVDAQRCRQIIEEQGEKTFESVFRAVLRAYAEKAGKSRVGEKTPGHTRFLAHLLGWFPDAQVLVMQRDPRAVVASQLKTPYVQKRMAAASNGRHVIAGRRAHEVAFYADNWRIVYEERLAPWKDDPRVHTVRYEELVQDPEREVRAVCDFLGEPFEPDVLADRTTSVPTPAGTSSDDRLERWRREHHGKSLGRVSSDSLGKWKQDLSRIETALIEGYCSEEMESGGYAFSMSVAERTVGRLLSHGLLSGGVLEARARRVDTTAYRQGRATN